MSINTTYVNYDDRADEVNDDALLAQAELDAEIYDFASCDVFEDLIFGDAS